MSDSAIPWTAALQASLSSTISWSLLEFMSTESVMLPNHLILCRPLLLLPSIFPSIRSFPMSQLFTSGGQSFSISPSSEYSWLISFRIDWFDLLAVQGTLKSPPTPQFKSISSSVLSLLCGPTHIRRWLLEKLKLWIYRPLLAKGYLCILICYLSLS